jgi:molybdate transport repressor ModE-like protein
MQHVPEIDALELLAAVVRRGSIAAAARELGITQQSASARIRGLERRLGLELFRRSPRGAAPTPAGETVASWAEEILAAASRFSDGVGMLRDEHRRELTVAASQTVASHLMPRWLVALRARQDAAGRRPTAVRMISANSAQVADLVREGRADLGVIEASRLPTGLARTQIASDELVLVVDPSHPWAGRSVTLEEVADTPLVVREIGSGTRGAWEDAVRTRLGREPATPAVELPASAAVRSAVAEGLAPALLSRLAVADDLRLGRLRVVPITAEPLTRPITALWRGGPRDLAPASRELLDIAVATARAHSH